MIGKHHVYLILARDTKHGIGKEGILPWDIPEDMAFFQRTTKNSFSGKEHMVVMGRKTWESIPVIHRPLKKRMNVVCSRTSDEKSFPEHIEVISSLDMLSSLVEQVDQKLQDVFIIGGSQIYKAALNMLPVDGIFLTEIDHDYRCDRFFDFDEGSFPSKKLLDEYVVKGIDVKMWWRGKG